MFYIKKCGDKKEQLELDFYTCLLRDLFMGEEDGVKLSVHVYEHLEQYMEEILSALSEQERKFVDLWYEEQKISPEQVRKISDMLKLSYGETMETFFECLHKMKAGDRVEEILKAGDRVEEILKQGDRMEEISKKTEQMGNAEEADSVLLFFQKDDNVTWTTEFQLPVDGEIREFLSKGSIIYPGRDGCLMVAATDKFEKLTSWLTNHSDLIAKRLMVRFVGTSIYVQLEGDEVLSLPSYLLNYLDSQLREDELAALEISPVDGTNEADYIITLPSEKDKMEQDHAGFENVFEQIAEIPEGPKWKERKAFLGIMQVCPGREFPVRVVKSWDYIDLYDWDDEEMDE